MKKHFASFDASLAEVMGRAFDDAWSTLQRDPLVTTSNADDVSEALAFRIIDTATRGERDQVQLRNDALVHVRGTILHGRR
jgi:hypothetical protein